MATRGTHVFALDIYALDKQESAMNLATDVFRLIHNAEETAQQPRSEPTLTAPAEHLSDAECAGFLNNLRRILHDDRLVYQCVTELAQRVQRNT